MAEPRAKHQGIPTSPQVELADKIRQTLHAVENAIMTDGDVSASMEKAKELLAEVSDFAIANHIGEYLTEEHVKDAIGDAGAHLEMIDRLADMNAVAHQMKLTDSAVDMFSEIDCVKSLVAAKDTLTKLAFGDRHDTLVSRKEFQERQAAQ